MIDRIWLTGWGRTGITWHPLTRPLPQGGEEMFLLRPFPQEILDATNMRGGEPVEEIRVP
jgi:hypothetical protein